MDEIVKAALKKWPDVPDCYGWLALDARGDWYLRDAAVQATGPFPQAKGSRLEHDRMREFIGRNYERDARGCWFFQNGPQRVFVELEAAPWVWRLQARPGMAPLLRAHTGQAAEFQAALMDESGRLFVVTDLGLGLVHTLDMEAAADAIELGQWSVATVRAAELPKRFGDCLSPQAEAGAAAAPHRP